MLLGQFAPVAPSCWQTPAKPALLKSAAQRQAKAKAWSNEPKRASLGRSHKSVPTYNTKTTKNNTNHHTAAPGMAAAQPRRVIRGIYGEELEEELQSKGIDIDRRTFSIPRFGAAKYQGLSDEDLDEQFRHRVASAGSSSCLVGERSKTEQTRLEQIVALAMDDCELWMRDVYLDVCSNPNPEREYKYKLLGETRERKQYYGNCNHMFTLLLDWDQVTTWLIKQAQWLNAQDGGARLYLKNKPAAPPAAAGGSTAEVKPLLCADRLSAEDRQRGESMAAFTAAATSLGHGGQNRWSCRANPVWDMLTSRLDLPFHKKLSDESVFHTLTYLWHHMKCGVYIKIRQNKLAMFVPFHNLEYHNAWSKAAEKHLPGSKEFAQSLEDYYAEKVRFLDLK